MSLALYRKYRSRSLDEIVGQQHITEILKRSLAQGRIAHAYLLTGPKGVGKTSIARILAHEINKLPYDEKATHLDIIEIDAASNNGVDDVRDLREKVQLAPVSATKKVYIIDEVHMLSKPAFNALLKTLEEPPEHVVFILATTDVDKLPATIISRVQQFGFRAITPADATKHLTEIAKKEKIKIDPAAIELIAHMGGGSFRDSISLLDQMASLADEKTGITRELVEQTMGLAPNELVTQLLVAHDKKDIRVVVEILDQAESLGIQSSVLLSQLIDTIRRQLVEQPQYVHLLDQLLEVSKSSQPAMKLLTVLASHASPRPKSVALSAPTPTISATIPELEKKAVQPKPAEPKPLAKKKPVNTTEFDWKKLLEYTAKNYVAINSVLEKCNAIVDSDELTLYAVNKFYKKKLDDPKYRQMLNDSLEALQVEFTVINTVATVSPPKDEQAAKVAAIMGGGEEVEPDGDGR